MAKVDIGSLKRLLKRYPELKANLAYARTIILCNTEGLGDFVTIMVVGEDDISPETLILKEELLKFARSVEAHFGTGKDE